MNNIIRYTSVSFLIFGLLFLTGCEKNKNDSGLPMDGDGNLYDTVAIGTQVWLTENLKTTKFNDGRDVRLITDDAEWTQTGLPACCWYNNDPTTYKDPNGALYNWYAGKLEMLCPVGYHVPTKDEWTTLADYLKAAPEDIKLSFKAKAVGMRVWNGSFTFIGSWWISSSDGSSYKVNQTFSIGGMPKNTGFSVRCVKNN